MGATAGAEPARRGSRAAAQSRTRMRAGADVVAARPPPSRGRAPVRAAARAGSGRARTSPRRCRRRRGCSRATRCRPGRERRASGSLPPRFGIASPSRAAIRSAYASRSSSVQLPSPTSSSPAASPLTRPAGSSCSWIQRIDLPAGARAGSSAHGWPHTIVASAGSSPRSASLTARDTASRPGVTCTIGARASRSASAPFHTRRLVECEVDLHVGAAVAESTGGLRQRRRAPRRHRAACRRAARRDAGHDRPARLHDVAVGQPDTGGAAAGHEDPLHVRTRAELAAGVTHDRGEAVDQHLATSAGHRHAAELDRGGDDLGHET